MWWTVERGSSSAASLFVKSERTCGLHGKTQEEVVELPQYFCLRRSARRNISEVVEESGSVLGWSDEGVRDHDGVIS